MWNCWSFAKQRHIFTQIVLLKDRKAIVIALFLRESRKFQASTSELFELLENIIKRIFKHKE